ncbi:hypothetical protein A6V39_04005 [Candidatus Mycoplasma haematobovis]|uniref:Uncharacterized protein n=1 Tax=Candidatus Mycoplasma haematobovis TaxID=432608 RepID=A0A1A9QBU7_9MOLU|nr:hypothetical protein [Candidatus Mycoplasma haematobovis]OAL10052.1 hypothetical protein A6V39_04005 [Candidatus Mycoplasma haematobovis]
MGRIIRDGEKGLLIGVDDKEALGIGYVLSFNKKEILKLVTSKLNERDKDRPNKAGEVIVEWCKIIRTLKFHLLKGIYFQILRIDIMTRK